MILWIMVSKTESKWQLLVMIIWKVFLLRERRRKQDLRLCSRLGCLRIVRVGRKLLLILRRVKVRWRLLSSILHIGIRVMDYKLGEVETHTRKLIKYVFQAKRGKRIRKTWISLNIRRDQSTVDQEIQTMLGLEKIQNWKAIAKLKDHWATEVLEAENLWVKVSTRLLTNLVATCITVL